MLNTEEIQNALEKLKRLMSQNCFEFVPRRDRNKSPVTSTLAKIIVENLTVEEFEKKELDRNGSGEYLWVFISEDGVRYYIKFKFLSEGKVKFISFHEAEF